MEVIYPQHVALPQITCVHPASAHVPAEVLHSILLDLYLSNLKPYVDKFGNVDCG